MLVLSPRDRIERLRSVDLKSDLDSADRDRIEQGMALEQNLSSYVTGIGGYGVYPTMVIDRYGLPWTAETIAHEWVHNYLAFHPLGWSFLEGGESVTINETVASIVGEELGQAMLEANYPDLVPPARPTRQGKAKGAGRETDSSEPPPFEFGPEMRATRLVVDELLKKGNVDEAEAFMEARRQTFIENGYPLRVLNQAYFAFHGSYATGAILHRSHWSQAQAAAGAKSNLARFPHHRRQHHRCCGAGWSVGANKKINHLSRVLE